MKWPDILKLQVVDLFCIVIELLTSGVTHAGYGRMICDQYVLSRFNILSGGLRIPAPLALALREDELFWADATRTGVLRVSKFGTDMPSQIYTNKLIKLKTVKVLQRYPDVVINKRGNYGGTKYEGAAI